MVNTTATATPTTTPTATTTATPTATTTPTPTPTTTATPTATPTTTATTTTTVAAARASRRYFPRRNASIHWMRTYVGPGPIACASFHFEADHSPVSYTIDASVSSTSVLFTPVSFPA